jgi:hypothetical protein
MLYEQLGEQDKKAAAEVVKKMLELTDALSALSGKDNLIPATSPLRSLA